MSQPYKYLLVILILVTVTVWIAVFTYPSPKLKLITCDVGQGDAALITYGTSQILIDGGPDNKVLDCLNKHLPFWDRRIDVVLLTHPDADHYTGLIDVFKRFDVGIFIPSSVDNSSNEYGVLKSEVGGKGIRVIKPSDASGVRLGMIQLDILYPFKVEENGNSGKNAEIMREKPNSEELKSGFNSFSTVATLSLGSFKALFTGDLPTQELDILALLRRVPEVDYIKIAHHGSKSSLSTRVYDVLRPEIAIISVGKDNKYGLPNKEVLDALQERNIKILRTDELGDIVVETDGKSIRVIK